MFSWCSFEIAIANVFIELCMSVSVILKMASKRTHGDNSDKSNNDERSQATAVTISKKKFTGSKTYNLAFKSEWKASYPIEEVKHEKYKFHCLPCGKNLTCHHQGLKDVKEQCNKPSHKQAHDAWMKQTCLPSSYRGNTENVFKNTVLNVEVMVTNFIIQHNLPIATADHLAKLYKNVLPDSELLHHMQVPK